MEQIPPSNPDELLNYLDNLNVEKEVDEYFSKNDKNNSGFIDANNYKNIFTNFNQKLGLKNRLGIKEWEWVLNLIKNKIDDMSIKDLMVGHSYFMSKDGNLLSKWKYEIFPLLMEYYKDGICSKAPLEDMDKFIKDNPAEEDSL